MDDFTSRIQILACPCKSNPGKFRAGSASVQDAHRIKIGNMGSERTGYPFDPAALLHQRPLRIEVVHILRPVFDGRIAKGSIRADKEFHTSCMKIRNIIFGSGTSFNKMEGGTFSQNNQCMFKLPGAFGVQAEIGLKRNIQLYPVRYINKRSP